MNDLTTYNDFFKEIVNTINSTKYEAYKALNKYHIGQNFEIGKLIVFALVGVFTNKTAFLVSFSFGILPSCRSYFRNF